MSEILEKPTDAEYAEFLQEALKVIEAYKEERVYFNVTPTFTTGQMRRAIAHAYENIAEARKLMESKNDL